jgi:outer membrane lipase/esterase
MKLYRTSLIAVIILVSIAIVGCGGGNNSDAPAPAAPKYSSLILFGDSLSDGGTYKVGTVAAIGGGKFTVNSPSAKVWIEVVSDYLGFSKSCAAQTGLPSVIAPGFLGEAVKDHLDCTNYAQGAARVDNLFASDSYALQQAVLKSAGLSEAIKLAPLGKMAVPAITQMEMHLKRYGGSYSGKELVVVSIGANDLFMNITAIPLAKAGGQNAGFAALFAGWSEAVQYEVSSNPVEQERVIAAYKAGHEYMAAAATKLLSNVKSQIVDKGAKSIVVMNLSDVGLTSVMLHDAQTSALATSLAKAFNDALSAGMKQLPEVVLVDTFAESQKQAANPTSYGLTNVRDVACGEAVPPSNAYLKGSSLGCSANTVISGDTSRYLYADGVHPTPYGHKLLADFFMTVLNSSNLAKK